MSRLGVDLAVTVALLLLGVVGLVETASFAERAAQWPRAVLTAFVLFVAIHLATLLLTLFRRRGR